MSSQLRTYLEEWDITLLNSDLDEIRNIVLEEEGFKWVPGLPEKEGWYLASYKENGIVDVDCIYFPTNFEVVAWMPLPKPYKP